jgi:hypothetical protein
MTIPPEAFTEIVKELERQPLEKNNYRPKVAKGMSQAFGIINRRCLPPDYSRFCWTRPLLYKHILDFATKYVDLSYNAITLNQDYQAQPHRDKGNKGLSYLVAFGDYTGGELNILEGDLSGNHNIRHKPIITDFSKVLHSVCNYTGHRYSLVFYTLKKEVNLPPPSIRFEDNNYYFYRGEEKILKKTGLPHPRRQYRKKKEI